MLLINPHKTISSFTKIVPWLELVQQQNRNTVRGKIQLIRTT